SLAGMSPRMIFIMVDLPAPLWPSSATRSPAATEKLTPVRAATPSNRLVSPEIVKVEVIGRAFLPAPRHGGFGLGGGGGNGNRKGLHQRMAVGHAPGQHRREGGLRPADQLHRGRTREQARRRLRPQDVVHQIVGTE